MHCLILIVAAVVGDYFPIIRMIIMFNRNLTFEVTFTMDTISTTTLRFPINSAGNRTNLCYCHSNSLGKYAGNDWMQLNDLLQGGNELPIKLQRIQNKNNKRVASVNCLWILIKNKIVYTFIYYLSTRTSLTPPYLKKRSSAPCTSRCNNLQFWWCDNYSATGFYDGVLFAKKRSNELIYSMPTRQHPRITIIHCLRIDVHFILSWSAESSYFIFYFRDNETSN